MAGRRDLAVLRDSFSVCFCATEAEARAQVCTLADRLRQAGLGPDRAGEVEVALAEAVNNIVEHAYVGAPGPVRLGCDLVGHSLYVRICDRGRPLPDGRVPAGLAANVAAPRADLPEGGFGWFLIRAFASDIRYERGRGCNHLSLRFDL